MRKTRFLFLIAFLAALALWAPLLPRPQPAASLPQSSPIWRQSIKAAPEIQTPIRQETIMLNQMTSSSPTAVARLRLMIVNTHISLGHLNVRTGPGFNYPVIFTLDENQAIMTTSEPGGWIAVETMDGRRGYANSAFLINPPEN